MDLAEAKRICLHQMNVHGLLEKGYTFEWLNSTRVFGRCNWGEKKIYLSKDLVAVNELEPVIDTILHEIAHALTPGHGHNKVWKQMCIKIGAKPERCFSFGEEQNQVKAPAGKFKYKGTCASGKHVFYRAVPPKGEHSCNRCTGKRKFDRNHLITFVRNTN